MSNKYSVTDVVSKKIMPVAEKIENQKHIQAIKNGMIAITPIIIVGSIFLLPMAIMNLLGDGVFYDFISKNISILTYGVDFTMGLLSLYATYFIANSLAKSYKLKSNQVAIASIITHLILTSVIKDGKLDISYLGSEGLFTAIISSIITVELYRFCINKNLYIKLPDSVPQMVGDSFSSLIPIFITAVVAVILSRVTFYLTGSIVPEALMKMLAPAVTSMDSLPAMLIIIFITQLFWFFGLHGPSITSSVWAPFAIQYGAANVAAYAAGQEVNHIFTFGFYFAILSVTGSGLTLGLNLMMLKAKSETYKSVGKVSLIPSLFGINEPLIFGTPILLNPFMFIPFVFGPLIITFITYFSMSTGLVGKPVAEPPGFLPPGLGAFIMTLDIKSVILVAVNLVIMALIYYPFFKAMDKNQFKIENQQKNSL